LHLYNEALVLERDVSIQTAEKLKEVLQTDLILQVSIQMDVI